MGLDRSPSDERAARLSGQEHRLGSPSPASAPKRQCAALSLRPPRSTASTARVAGGRSPRPPCGLWGPFSQPYSTVRSTSRLCLEQLQRRQMQPAPDQRGNRQDVPATMGFDGGAQVGGVPIDRAPVTHRMGTPCFQACSSIARAYSGLVWKVAFAGALTVARRARSQHQVSGSNHWRSRKTCPRAVASVKITAT